jgi:hypothetical protein
MNPFVLVIRGLQAMLSNLGKIKRGSCRTMGKPDDTENFLEHDRRPLVHRGCGAATAAVVRLAAD